MQGLAGSSEQPTVLQQFWPQLAIVELRYYRSVEAPYEEILTMRIGRAERF
jgi:hypothetical protein